MKNILRIIYMFSLLIIFASCDDEFEGKVVRDNRPAIPVTFDGSTNAGFNPYYTVSYAGGNFTITLRIPESSALKIKEVSNVVAGATSINVASLTDPKQYLAAPVVVNGTSYTLSSSITEFNTKAISSPVNSAPAAGALVERAFMFKLTMDDNSVIIPVQCRIRITP